MNKTLNIKHNTSDVMYYDIYIYITNYLTSILVLELYSLMHLSGFSFCLRKFFGDISYIFSFLFVKTSLNFTPVTSFSSKIFHSAPLFSFRSTVSVILFLNDFSFSFDKTFLSSLTQKTIYDYISHN